MLQKFARRLATVVGTILLLPSLAFAGIVNYSATSLGGNLWRYDYTINNMSPSLQFDELTIYFDVNRYDLLSAPTAPSGWDPIVVQPDIALPADGFYDTINLGPLGTGTFIDGFSVSFAYLSAGTPGPQTFDLLDSSRFLLVYTGSSEKIDDQFPVHEPSALAMILLGLCSLLAVNRRLRVRSQDWAELH